MRALYCKYQHIYPNELNEEQIDLPQYFIILHKINFINQIHFNSRCLKLNLFQSNYLAVDKLFLYLLFRIFYILVDLYFP